MIVGPRPMADNDSKPYWDFLKQKELRLQKCTQCGKYRYPAFPSCVHCGTDGGEWTAVSGRGRLYSWIVVHHPIDHRLKPEVPFVVGLVELEEGPRMVGRIVSCEKLHKDMAVRGVFEVIDKDLTLLNFKSS
jgi:uncharacterized protein